MGAPQQSLEPGLMIPWWAPPPSRGRSRLGGDDRGQSLVEFAIIVPILLLLVVAIADFGRLYTSAVAVEAAAREAADSGAFKSNNWTPANVPVTLADMEKRACIAAAGSHLEGYDEPAGTVEHATCTNPAFSCFLEWGGTSVDCASSGGFVGSTNCSITTTEPPCTVRVRLDYDFDTILSFPPLPETISFSRDSRFRMQDLEAAP